ncbi:MAG: HD domain-containing protein [Chthoniobacterales bacterium]
MPHSVTIKELRNLTRDGASCEALIPAQAESITLKETAQGKPFYEVNLRDATGNLTLRAWSDKAAFSSCQKLTSGDFVQVTGNFSNTGSFGIDAPGWKIEPLSEEGTMRLLEGSTQQQAASDANYQLIVTTVESITDPRLKKLCGFFLTQHGLRFRRAAAARNNHHARRGGLLDHTAQMMRSAIALLSVYPQLNRDLLIAGTLFHDSGKLWETCPPALGFGILPELRGELMGHLSIGIELVNSLWRELPKEDWSTLQPSSEQVRLHLLHLIASHHGQLDYGSPVLPKTPEAIALHLIDNLDARIEMFNEAYARAEEIAPEIFEWVRPLGVSPIAPLEKMTPA